MTSQMSRAGGTQRLFGYEHGKKHKGSPSGILGLCSVADAQKYLSSSVLVICYRPSFAAPLALGG